MNPFKKDGQMLPIASINSVFVDDILASDSFRPELIVFEVLDSIELLGIDPKTDPSLLLNEFNNSLRSKNKAIKNKANEIAVSFGRKLAQVLITLRKPSEDSLRNRLDWTKEHWDYWKGVKQIYFVGGLTSPILTKVFYNQIKLALKKHKIKDLKISFIEGSVDLGTKGLSSLVSNGEYLLFDFGQTNIKRRHVIYNNDDIEIDKVLPPVKSKYLRYKNENEEDLIKIANELDSFIIETVLNSVDLVGFEGSDILIGIANYVNDGNIYPYRGGYGKLNYIKGNYEAHLSNTISFLLKREIFVRLYHDTSSMALNFMNSDRTAVISLGTAFGVAFPE